VGGLGLGSHDAQTGELIEEGSLEALGLAIECALEEGAVGALALAKALPNGLGVAGTGDERARGVGFEVMELEPVGGPGERLEKVFHGANVLGESIEFIVS
jgi:hypothetical protein